MEAAESSPRRHMRHADFLRLDERNPGDDIAPAGTAPSGQDYSFGQAFDFEVTCGRCGLSVCCLSVQIYGSETDFSGQSDHHISEPFLGRDGAEGHYQGTHRPGTGRSRELQTREGLETREGPRYGWILECPGVKRGRCRMRQKIGLELLDRAVVRAFRKGRHELILGVDFTREITTDRYVGAEVSAHVGAGNARTFRALRRATPR